MPNELRQQYDRMAEEVERAGLLPLELRPHPFPDRWEVELGGRFKFMGKTVLEALDRADTWLDGYVCGRKAGRDEANADLDQDQYDRMEEERRLEYKRIICSLYGSPVSPGVCNED